MTCCETVEKKMKHTAPWPAVVLSGRLTLEDKPMNHRNLSRVEDVRAIYHSYFPQTLRDWNRIPQHIIDSPAIDNFKYRIHQHLSIEYLGTGAGHS